MNLVDRLTALSESGKVRIVRFITHPITVLLLVDILVYAYFIPLQGFYWDDLDFVWFYQSYGLAGLADFFARNRTVLGLLYQLNFFIMGVEPWHWQVFALVCRWVCSISLYFLIRQVWKGNREAALFVGLFFLVYPCFTQHAIAIVYSHFNIVMSCLFFSLGLTLYTIEHKKHRSLFTFFALMLAVLNLLTMEYFFMLELLRPVLLWSLISREPLGIKEKGRRLLTHYAPYLLVFLGGVIWREFFFKRQNIRFQFTALELLKTSPWLGIKELVWNALKDLWTTVIACWQGVVTFPKTGEIGLGYILLSVVITIAVVVMLGLFLLCKRSETFITPEIQHRDTRQFIIHGFLALLLGGVPFWLTGLSPTTTFPGSRFALPFLLGSAMVTVGLLTLVFRNKLLRRSIFILLIALAAGAQVRQEARFMYDWQNMQRFLWQAVWRMPTLKPDTVLFSEDLPFHYFTDLSITAPINMIYSVEPQEGKVDYVFYYPSVRMLQNGVVNMDPGQEISYKYDVGMFSGNIDDSLTLYYTRGSCLRVIDAYLESENFMLPLSIREASQVSNLEVIGREENLNLPGNILGPEPSGSWCYYFEKADLARQYRDWETVAEIAQTAFVIYGFPSDPVESTPFIEGYANTGQWQQALELTERAMEYSHAMDPVLCRLWARIDYETPDSPLKQETLSYLDEQLSCEFR
jgi:hypothetical protein